MIRSSEEEVSDQFKQLQHDWRYSKKLSPHHPLRELADPGEIISLMDTSPRELVSSLHKFPSSSSGWKVSTNPLAVEEVIRERRAAIDSARLKGRRLFDAFDGGSELGFQEKCSASSPIMIHGSEVRSSFCCNLAGEDDGVEAEVCDGDEGGSVCEEDVEKEKVVVVVGVEEKGEVAGDGGCVCEENVVKENMPSVEEKGGFAVGIVRRLWWMVRAAWLAFAVVVFALVVMSGKSFDGRLDGERLIPT